MIKVEETRIVANDDANIDWNRLFQVISTFEGQDIVVKIKKRMGKKVSNSHIYCLDKKKSK